MTIKSLISKHILFHIMLFILIIGIPDSAFTKSKGSTDWIKGFIISYGSSKVAIKNGTPIDKDNNIIPLNKGRIDAYERAKEIAVENLIKSIKKIKIDSDNSFDSYLKNNEITQSRLTDIILNKTKFSEYPLDFYTSGCKAELKISEIISAVQYKYPSHNFPTRIDNPISTDYSSLIIDTRGLGVTPMLFPSIYNEEGLEIYGRYFIDIRYAAKNGIVSYAYTEDEAMNNRKKGEYPYFTVAVKGLNGSPVLSDRDVKKIYSSNNTLKHLKKCRVIFIIDKKKKY